MSKKSKHKRRQKKTESKPNPNHDARFVDFAYLEDDEYTNCDITDELSFEIHQPFESLHWTN